MEEGAGGDPFVCNAFYCAQDRGYWSDSQKKCYRSGFIGTHRQTRSNAGSCPGCTVSVFHVVQSDAFAMVASNGWVATMRYTDEQRRVATGQGTWPANFGAYSGKPFTVTLKRSADAKSFEMQADTAGVGQIIARFAMGPRLPALSVAVPP